MNVVSFLTLLKIQVLYLEASHLKTLGNSTWTGFFPGETYLFHMGQSNQNQQEIISKLPRNLAKYLFFTFFKQLVFITSRYFYTADLTLSKATQLWRQ